MVWCVGCVHVNPIVLLTALHAAVCCQVGLEEPGTAVTKDPLVVLVNENSASASEILSGALHDQNRAIIIGDHNTYGKGRIQSVFELQDGSALFVTVAKYETPNGTEIDLKGIHPDQSCTPDSIDFTRMAMGGVALSGVDSPPRGGAYAPGLPMGPGSEERLLSQLSNDTCVLTAADLLHGKSAMIQATAAVASKMMN